MCDIKVVSIKEPFATLINNDFKKSRTKKLENKLSRELFIHASGKCLAKEFLTNNYVINLIKDMDMNYGNIICKCNLVDCVYMDENFINYIKQNH